MLQRLNRELMVLGNRENHLAAVSVPPGKIFEVLGYAQDDRFLRIKVDGEIFEAFETDVVGRSESCIAPPPARVSHRGRRRGAAA